MRKIVLTMIAVIAAVSMVGFGMCGVWGLIAGEMSFNSYDGLVTISGLLGIGIAIVLFFVCRMAARAIYPSPNKVESDSVKTIDTPGDQ